MLSMHLTGQTHNWRELRWNLPEDCLIIHRNQVVQSYLPKRALNVPRTSRLLAWSKPSWGGSGAASSGLSSEELIGELSGHVNWSSYTRLICWGCESIHSNMGSSVYAMPGTTNEEASHHSVSFRHASNNCTGRELRFSATLEIDIAWQVARRHQGFSEQGGIWLTQHPGVDFKTWCCQRNVHDSMYPPQNAVRCGPGTVCWLEVGRSADATRR